MTTIYFIWEDGHQSAEPFRNNTEFYEYMDAMAEEGYYPESMTADGIELVGDGYDDSQGNRVEIEIAW